MKSFYADELAESAENLLTGFEQQQQAQQQPQDAQETPNQPFYVNAKQYHRILKRRIARAKLEEKLKVERIKKPYLHESRHKHAMRRPRGQGGRFLTAAEIAELKLKEQQQQNDSKDSITQTETPPATNKDDENEPENDQEQNHDDEPNLEMLQSPIPDVTDEILNLDGDLSAVLNDD